MVLIVWLLTVYIYKIEVVQSYYETDIICKFIEKQL